MQLSQWLKAGLMSVILLGSAMAYAETPAPATASSSETFTPAQQKAIQKIVHDYLVNDPQVLIEAATALQQQQQAQWQKTANQTVPAMAQALFADPASPVAGDPKGDVTLVEFFDYQCPHCKDMMPEINDLIKTDKNLRVVFKQLPIFGENSEFAARASLAAQNQNKFLPFHNALLATNDRLTPDVVIKIATDQGLNIKQLQTDMQSPAISQEIKTNYQLAKALKLVGTPGFVVAKVAITNQKVGSVQNPILIPGAVDEGTLQQAVTQARTGAQQ